jgi:SAM-dependent methyltransferase
MHGKGLPHVIDDTSDIRTLYDQGPEVEQNRLQRHQLELELTRRLLRRYLPKEGRILEVGAGVCAYTVGLLREGYRVTAVDFAAGVLRLARKAIEEAGLSDSVELIEADARDLSAVDGTDYDAVLLMGPLYHLVVEEDRRLALRQARERLRTGGVIFTAHISRYGIMGDLMRNIPHWVENRGEVESILARGRDPDDHPRGGFRGYYAPVEEIGPFHDSEGFEQVCLAAVEPFIGGYDESYNELEGERRALWLDLSERLCTQPSTVGASRHLLYVGTKR